MPYPVGAGALCVLFITILLFRDAGGETPGMRSPGRGPPATLSRGMGVGGRIRAGGSRVALSPPPPQPWGGGKAGCSFAALAAGAAAATSGALSKPQVPHAAHPTASPSWDKGWDRQVVGTLLGTLLNMGQRHFSKLGLVSPTSKHV